VIFLHKRTLCHNSLNETVPQIWLGRCKEHSRISVSPERRTDEPRKNGDAPGNAASAAQDSEHDTTSNHGYVKQDRRVPGNR
jgi:hypothetical protein